MSAIASFYLLQHQDVDRLKDLATQPVGPAAGGKWHDPYWEFLFANARELQQFEWSGYVMLDVWHLLDSRSTKLEEYCDKPLSDCLRKARRGTILVFRAEPGKTLAQRITADMPDEKTLEAFLTSAETVAPDGDHSPAEAVLDGLHILKSWLSDLDEHHVGLLTIG
jgi:hypothetical protein